MITGVHITNINTKLSMSNVTELAVRKVGQKTIVKV